jgi:hypothetical protein
MPGEVERTVPCGFSHGKTMGKPWENGDFTGIPWGSKQSLRVTVMEFES